MAKSEFLRRIDAEIARTNEILEEDRAAWQRAMDSQGNDLKDIRFEQRQMSLRGERVAQGYLRVLEDMSDELRANTQELRANTQGYLRVLEDMSDELRANTRAVLSVLDRLEGGGGPAASGA